MKYNILPFVMERKIIQEIALRQRSDFQTRPRGTPREALALVERHLRKPHAIIISGVRRCGKSTLLLQIADAFLKEDFFYFNFEDERLINFGPEDFSVLHEVLIGCFGEHAVFVFDEVQNAPNWESFVRRMQDSGFKFILTGSNASLLSREFGTKLTGRHVGIGLYPFSFREYALFKKCDLSGNVLLSPEGRATCSALFEEYRIHGGFPEYLRHNDAEVLTQLYEDILYRDVAARHDIKNTRTLRELALYYMSNVSTLCSFNKLKTMLGVGSTTTVSAYTGYFEQSYLFSTTTIFDPSIKRQSIAPKKIYAVDPGLAAKVSLSFSKNLGALTENLVFLELARRKFPLYYYKTRSGREVDFVCTRGKRVEELIQVALSIEKPETREREITALTETCSELGVKRGLLLTDHHEEEVRQDRCLIHMVPTPHWLLRPPEDSGEGA